MIGPAKLTEPADVIEEHDRWFGRLIYGGRTSHIRPAEVIHIDAGPRRHAVYLANRLRRSSRSHRPPKPRGRSRTCAA